MSDQRVIEDADFVEALRLECDLQGLGPEVDDVANGDRPRELEFQVM